MADVELLVMADQLLKELGISDGVTLTLNTLGDGASREAWREALVDYFRAVRAELSEDSQERLEKNPLRILDSKDPRDKVFFARVTGGLDAAGVAWTRNSALVRGLDYYRHTAFEFVSDRLGAQGTVLGGGRYDGLMESLGGAATPAVGWAAGVERLAMLVADAGGLAEDRAEVAVVAESATTELEVGGLVAYLRRAGVKAEAYVTGGVRKRYDRAIKALPAIAISLDIRDGVPHRGVRYLDAARFGADRLQPLLDAFDFSKA